MAYTNSSSQAGRGSVFALNTGTVTTPVWTPIGEIRSTSLTGASWKTVDVTNFESSINSEFISTIRDNGMWKLTCNRVSTDAGQAALESAFNSGALTQFQITLLPNPTQTAGDTITFSALVETYDIDVAVEKENSLQVSLKVSGSVVLTVGA